MGKKTSNHLRSVKGGVTAASGFSASGIKAGIKTIDVPDLGIIYSKVPCKAAGVFTTNAVRAASVTWSEALLPSENIHAVCCNSGNANACTGNRGKKDVITTAASLASLLKIKKESVLIASTGVIGKFLPVDRVKQSLPESVATLSGKNGRQFATAIMTTDTKEKEYALRVAFSKGVGTIGGCAKGAGMIHPDMATMLAFITTDIDMPAKSLNRILKKVVDMTFNNLTIDGDTSTNDMVLILANGCSGLSIKSKEDITFFEEALFTVCNTLCAKIAEDGEGATKRIEINVTGGKTYTDCKRAAKAVANSNLVKTALFGSDPNWGRILCAVGYSGAQFSRKNSTISLCGIPVYQNMSPAVFRKRQMTTALKKKIVAIDIDLGYNTKTCAVAHTCDLTYDYIKINAEYHT